MAGSAEAQRRQRWLERRVRQLLRERHPNLHAQLWATAAEEWAAGAGAQPDYLVRLEAATADIRAAVEDSRRARLRAEAAGNHV